MHGYIPDEVYCGKLVDYFHSCIFGCDEFSHLPKEKSPKLGSNSSNYVYLGYDNTIKGFILWDPIGYNIIVNWDVIFNEQFMQQKEVQFFFEIVPVEVEISEDESEVYGEH